MGRKTYKQMTKDEFIDVAERQWVPIVLLDAARPNLTSAIPEDRVHLVLASGSFIDPRIVEANGITYSGVVGGMDIYRYDEKDVGKGYPFNKDHYIIIQHPTKDEVLLLAGPIKDDEHWLNKLPELDPKIEILEFKGTVIEPNGD